MNYDGRCGSSTFTISLTAPAGFSVSLLTTSVTLRSATDTYVYAKVTSPSAISDGAYALTATATRTDGPSGSASSYYDVYSSDSTAPTLYYLNPADGVTVSGNSYHAAATSSDDHAVKQIEFYLDGVYKGSTACDDISYECTLSYTWSLSGVSSGQHVATFKSYDWMGNVVTRTTTFTVG
jgi:Bacterial Ig domain